MKDNLLELINKTEEIEKLFHNSSDSMAFDIIYDRQEFLLWLQEIKLELREIHDRTKDTFIWETINDLSANFNGWHDRQMFNKIKGNLFAIRKNIEKYFPQTNNNAVQGREKEMLKKSKLFISHSSKDKQYVEEIVSMFDDMGLSDEYLFCSSIPGYDIPLGKSIFDYLMELFQDYDLHIVFVHSKNYYQSPISLNEMGAAWALKKNYTSILLPGFDFSEMKGIVNNANIAIKLDRSEDELKDKLNQLYDQIIAEFGIKKKNHILWEKKRDSFIKNILAIQPLGNTSQNLISKEAYEMLQELSKDDNAIIKTITLSGTTIHYGQKSIADNQGQREFAKWDSAVDTLVEKGFIKKVSTKDYIYKITNAGYEYLEKNQNQ